MLWILIKIKLCDVYSHDACGESCRKRIARVAISNLPGLVSYHYTRSAKNAADILETLSNPHQSFIWSLGICQVHMTVIHRKVEGARAAASVNFWRQGNLYWFGRNEHRHHQLLVSLKNEQISLTVVWRLFYFQLYLLGL